MREVRSGSLAAVVRSAHDRRALRRLSRSCFAALERRCTGTASSSGSLHTSREACTVCRRRDTGGDVSRDTNDSNISLSRCGTSRTNHGKSSHHVHYNPFSVARSIPTRPTTKQICFTITSLVACVLNLAASITHLVLSVVTRSADSIVDRSAMVLSLN